MEKVNINIYILYIISINNLDFNETEKEWEKNLEKNLLKETLKGFFIGSSLVFIGFFFKNKFF